MDGGEDGGEGRFTYTCPAKDCEGEMRGSVGDDVTCPVCSRTWTTDWEYTDEDSMTAWITGEAADGRGEALPDEPATS